MSGDSLHFLSEAKLAQTARFIETVVATLARLQTMTAHGTLEVATLREFTSVAETAGRLRTQLAGDLQPLLDDTLRDEAGGLVAGPPGTDPAAQRLIAATRHVLDRLDEMIIRLQGLQRQEGDSGDLSARP